MSFKINKNRDVSRKHRQEIYNLTSKIKGTPYLSKRKVKIRIKQFTVFHPQRDQMSMFRDIICQQVSSNIRS